MRVLAVDVKCAGLTRNPPECLTILYLKFGSKLSSGSLIFMKITH